MFDIGWTEILVIAIVAIVVFPSKDLPRLLRTTGQMVGRVRRMAGEFQSQFNAALREAEREVDLAETRKQIEDLKGLNPANQVKKALDPLRTAGEDIRRELGKPGPQPGASSQFVPPKEAAAAEPAPPPAAIDVPAPAVAPQSAPKIEPPAAPDPEPKPVRASEAAPPSTGETR